MVNQSVLSEPNNTIPQAVDTGLSSVNPGSFIGTGSIRTSTNPITISDGVITANFGNLNIGESGTVNITLTSIAAGNLISTTDVTSNESDANPLDNLIVGRKIVNSTIPMAIDLELNQTVDNPNPAIGDQVTLTLTLTNQGPGTATNIKVIDLLPAELSFISYTALQGTYDSNTGIWDVGNMRDNLSRSLTITAEVNGGQSITNTAEVTAVFEPDIDSTPNNNNFSEDDLASTTLTVHNGNNVINGDDSNNTLSGTSNPDTINGLAGDDFIDGLASDDSIDGGIGNFDWLLGGVGNDTIVDPDGVLISRGGLGNDIINIIFAAGWDNDTKPGNSPRSDGKITGGYGDDVITITMNKIGFFLNIKGDNSVSNTPQDGNDIITLLGTYGNAVVDLGGGDDIFTGGIATDNISAGDGNDNLLGLGGNDQLAGQNGNDTLRGGLGNDKLTGGSDADIFVLADGEGKDTITDFQNDTDLIGLSGSLTFDALTFSSNNIIFGSQLLATLNGFNTSTLTASDFVSV